MVIHPLLLHFPVALLLVGDLALLVDIIKTDLLAKNPAGRLAFEGFVNGVLGLGYAGLVLTVVTGLFDMQASPKTQAREGWIVVAVCHIIAAVSLLVIYGVLLYRRFVILPLSTALSDLVASITPPDREITSPDAPLQLLTKTELVSSPHPRRDWFSLALVLLGLVVLVLAGWLGGSLVYDWRVGSS